MKIKFNRVTKVLPPDVLTLQHLTEWIGVTPVVASIRVNGRDISSAKWGITFLRDGDEITIA